MFGPSIMAPSSAEILGLTKRREQDEYDAMVKVFRDSIATSASLEGFYKKSYKPVHKECKGCGAPLKMTAKPCEYCNRSPE